MTKEPRVFACLNFVIIWMAYLTSDEVVFRALVNATARMTVNSRSNFITVVVCSGDFTLLNLP